MTFRRTELKRINALRIPVTSQASPLAKHQAKLPAWIDASAREKG